MLLWPSISLALSGAWCILPHRIGSDQINKALLLGLASPNSMRYTGFMALNLKQERLLRLPACDWPKGLKVSPSDLAERSLGFTYLSWMIKMEKLPDLVRHYPDAIQDPKLWLKHSYVESVHQYYPGLEGNSLHEAINAGHFKYVPDRIKKLGQACLIDDPELFGQEPANTGDPLLTIQNFQVPILQPIEVEQPQRVTFQDRLNDGNIPFSVGVDVEIIRGIKHNIYIS
jgi:hypothetical protein